MILVLVKSFDRAKQRLAPVLSSSQRRSLARAMLQDVLGALAVVPGNAQVAVVTSDEDATRLTTSRGFEVIDDSGHSGLNAAANMASGVAATRGASFSLVLPADVPLVTPAEIAVLMAARQASRTVLAPATGSRGTNAILRQPPTLFPLQFGVGSFGRHLDAAAASGRPFTVLHLPGVGFDIDEPADLIALAKAPGDTAAQRLVRGWRGRAALYEVCATAKLA